MKAIIDLCMKQPEGKYVLVRDPNKVRSLLHSSLHPKATPIVSRRADLARGTYLISFPHTLFTCSPSVWQPVIRLYSVPANAFTEEEEEDGAEDVDEPEAVA